MPLLRRRGCRGAAIVDFVLVLVVLVLVINLLGDWLRDVMNPRLYKG